VSCPFKLEDPDKLDTDRQAAPRHGPARTGTAQLVEIPVEKLRSIAASTRLNAQTLRQLADERRSEPDKLRDIADALDEKAESIDEQADQAAD
jgi:hypothetical protein